MSLAEGGESPSALRKKKQEFQDARQLSVAVGAVDSPASVAAPPRILQLDIGSDSEQSTTSTVVQMVEPSNGRKRASTAHELMAPLSLTDVKNLANLSGADLSALLYRDFSDVASESLLTATPVSVHHPLFFRMGADSSPATSPNNKEAAPPTLSPRNTGATTPSALTRDTSGGNLLGSGKIPVARPRRARSMGTAESNEVAAAYAQTLVVKLTMAKGDCDSMLDRFLSDVTLAESSNVSYTPRYTSEDGEGMQDPWAEPSSRSRLTSPSAQTPNVHTRSVWSNASSPTTPGPASEGLRTPGPQKSFEFAGSGDYMARTSQLPPHFAESLARLRDLAQRLRATPVQELRKDSHKQMAATAAKLYALSQNWADDWPWRRHITRLLLATSKVSRLLEHASYATDGDDNVPLTPSTVEALTPRGALSGSEDANAGSSDGSGRTQGTGEPTTPRAPVMVGRPAGSIAQKRRQFASNPEETGLNGPARTPWMLQRIGEDSGLSSDDEEVRKKKREEARASPANTPATTPAAPTKKISSDLENGPPRPSAIGMGPISPATTHSPLGLMHGTTAVTVAPPATPQSGPPQTPTRGVHTPLVITIPATPVSAATFSGLPTGPPVEGSLLLSATPPPSTPASQPIAVPRRTSRDEPTTPPNSAPTNSAPTSVAGSVPNTPVPSTPSGPPPLQRTPSFLDSVKDSFKSFVSSGKKKNEKTDKPGQVATTSPPLSANLAGVPIVQGTVLPTGAPSPLTTSPTMTANRQRKASQEDARPAPFVRQTSVGTLSGESVASSPNETSTGEDTVYLRCRICEQMFPTQELSEHSKSCFAIATQEASVASCNQQLQTYARDLAKQIADNKNKNTIEPGVTILAARLVHDIISKQALSEAPTYSGSIELCDHAIQQLEQIIKSGRQELVSGENTQFHRFVNSVIEELRKKIAALRRTEHTANQATARIISPPNKKLGRRDEHRDSGSFSHFIIPTIKDFHIIKRISAGAYGRVFLASKKSTGDLYAIKVIRKADMVRKNQLKHVQAEQDILLKTNNPFLVSMYYSFQSSRNLYLVMEYLNGGDLLALLKSFGVFEEDHARIYLAEVVQALQALHAMGVVHRDLKPENLLIDHQGHIRLTDFGLSGMGLIDSTDESKTKLDSAGAGGRNDFPSHHHTLEAPTPTQATAGITVPTPKQKARSGDDWIDPILSPRMMPMSPRKPTVLRADPNLRRDSQVGTPDYLAPEIILGTGHTYTVDWWSLGVIAYEFLTGAPPFSDTSIEGVFSNIVNRRIEWPAIPDEMSYEARSLIDQLLCHDPRRRLGAKGGADVKAHPFFAGVEWDKLLDTKGPVVPKPVNAHDLSYHEDRTVAGSEFDKTEDELRSGSFEMQAEGSGERPAEEQAGNTSPNATSIIIGKWSPSPPRKNKTPPPEIDVEEGPELPDLAHFNMVNPHALLKMNKVLTRDPSPSDSPNISRSHSRASSQTINAADLAGLVESSKGMGRQPSKRGSLLEDRSGDKRASTVEGSSASQSESEGAGLRQQVARKKPPPAV